MNKLWKLEQLEIIEIDIEVKERARAMMENTMEKKEKSTIWEDMCW